MRSKGLLFSVLFAMPTIASAQYNSKGEQKSRFRPGIIWYSTGLRPASPERVRKYDRLIFDLTFNTWNGELTPFENKAPSLGLNTNVMFDIPLAKGNKVALGIGVAHELRNIRHDNSFLVDSTGSFTIYQMKDSTMLFQRSSFGANSFSLPIELRFRNESWKHFKFHVGGRIGIQANAFNRSVTSIDGIKHIDKQVGFPDLNRLTYGVHARLGIRNWALFANYSLNTVFVSQESVELNFLQFGLSISLY